MSSSTKKHSSGPLHNSFSKSTRSGRVASVADAKAHLPSLLREVERHHVEITVLRRGTPVAKITPVDTAAPVSGFGWMLGSVQEIGDIVGPSGEAWDVHDEESA